MTHIHYVLDMTYNMHTGRNNLINYKFISNAPDQQKNLHILSEMYEEYNKFRIHLLYLNNKNI